MLGVVPFRESEVRDARFSSLIIVLHHTVASLDIPFRLDRIASLNFLL
jgi:hypothetical protein